MLSVVLASVVSLVNPFVGTGGTGHAHPAATAPFGMVQAGPDTGAGDWDHCSSYQYGDRRILGFSQTHLSGTGWVDYGDVQIIPYADRRYRDDGSHFKKETEKAMPGYYAVELPDFGVTVEATASERVAVYRIRVPEKSTANLVVNLPFGVYEKRWATKRWRGHEEKIESPRLITGSYRRSVWATRTVAYAIGFSADATITRLEPVVDEPPRFRCAFGCVPNGELVVRIALSKTDAAGAKRNLATADGQDFDEIRAATEAKWESLLGRFEAEGEEESKRIFYTALYHCAFQPNLMTDEGEQPLYTTFSIWDAGRACFPLYALWTPEMVKPLVDSFLHFHDRQGYLPIFTVGDCETHCMIASHVVPVLENWRQSGVAPEVDWKAVYAAVAKSLKHTVKGRSSMWQYDLINRYGYLPHDLVAGQSVSRTLEKCLDDVAASRMATAMGETEDAVFFANRAYAWTNLFDQSTGFFRGKLADGSWRPSFDPLRCDHGTTKGGEFTEGNAWQYRWHVMQHPEALVATLGGKERFVKELDTLFSLPSKVYGNDNLVDVTGLIGQYAHGNEPCHHIPYFYQYAGRPDRTAERIREICRTQYSLKPDGLCGNDDCGQMSAWYVFAALGFYPFDPSSGEYVIGAPQLGKIRLRLPGGRTLAMTARNLSEQRKHVRSVAFDGRQLKGFVLRQADVFRGGELAFEMAEK